jgi:DNA-nicking Smr family endonuclease
VHAVLERHELVVAFRLADEREGGWGATLVQLRPPRKG